MSFRRDIEDFLMYCEITKQYSINTLKSYRKVLGRLATFLEEKQSIYDTKEIDLVVVDKYRKHLSKQLTNRGEKMSQKTQGYQIVILRSFLKFMIKNDFLVLSPEKLELPKTRMRRVEFLTDIEIKKLLKEIEKDKKSLDVQKKRNVAIILTIFGSGLRISELLSIRKADIFDLDDNTVVVEGKGGKTRPVFLSDDSVEAINEYLELRGNDLSPYLFISHSRNRSKNPKNWKSVTPRMAQMMLQSYAKRAGIFKEVTPHKLRHSFATKVLREGGDLRSVQTMLGHSNISTTQVYTHVTDWQIRQLHSKVFRKNLDKN